MRHNCCHFSFASTLKILNFVQAFFGVSIIIYSIWMLDQYNRHVPVDPPPSPPTAYLDEIDFQIFLLRTLGKQREDVYERYIQQQEEGKGLNRGPHEHSAISDVSISMMTHYLDESFLRTEEDYYSILKTLLILLEAALVAYIAIDRHWEKDLPYDPTGELNSLRAFIEENIGICKWVGVAVLAVQLLSLLLALVLRAMVSTPTPDPDDEEDYENPRNRARDPLLGSQASAGSSKNENWSSRIRERYGLNQAQAVNPKG
ncbi:unnamed protein product [Microthlaspi erraticum]|uniref:Uncharacterized protein n=1 Tax=Microthlaspi erraticum TaxID=1685480 RepID=A0A6D2HDJ1_9BRAS|nr:unnamed protein product [Microthlaspi erraticum]